jgi:hypothetical protein
MYEWASKPINDAFDLDQLDRSSAIDGSACRMKENKLSCKITD